MIENRNFLCQAFTIQVVNFIFLITKQGPMGLNLHMSIYLFTSCNIYKNKCFVLQRH